MNTKIIVYGFLICIMLGLSSCDKDHSWETIGEDFEAPALTEKNTIQFTIHIDQWSILEIYLKGRTVIDWGDGKKTKLGTNFNEDAPSHKYPQGEYRVKIWSEELTFLNTSSMLLSFSDLHLGNCPLLESLYTGCINGTTHLELSSCPRLETLNIGSCPDLVSIDVSQCPQLRDLLCYSNPKLEVLDTSHNLSLSTLDCSFGNLSTLSLAKNDALQTLKYDYNQLTSLDLSRCPQLSDLICGGNQLTELDLSGLSYLGTVSCGKNRLSSLLLALENRISHLSCADNELDAEALNSVFRSLRQYVVKPNGSPYSITFYGNPGEMACNTEILAEKNWVIKKEE